LVGCIGWICGDRYRSDGDASEYDAAEPGVEGTGEGNIVLGPKAGDADGESLTRDDGRRGRKEGDTPGSITGDGPGDVNDCWEAVHRVACCGSSVDLN